MTDFLYAVPSVVDGIASVIDLFGLYPNYNDSSTPKQADTRANIADILSLKKDANYAYETLVNNDKTK